MKSKLPRTRIRRFVRDVYIHTPFTKLVLLMLALWLLFSTGLFLAETNVQGGSVDSWPEALYWGVAAFSTAGIADMPTSATGQLVGGLWIVIGSVIFFGGIVATITTYFMRPMQRPHKKIIDTIEYNLEQLNDLSIEELDLLKDTVDMLIAHVEHLKERH
jgi:voltage-gated potassium channel